MPASPSAVRACGTADSHAAMQACKAPVQTAHRTRLNVLQGLAREALTLLEGALALWPATPVKLHYIEKLIQTNQAANVDPPPALIIGGRPWQLSRLFAMASHLSVMLEWAVLVLTLKAKPMPCLLQGPARAGHICASQLCLTCTWQVGL